MGKADHSLCTFGKIAWRAHFGLNGIGDVINTPFINFSYGGQQVYPLLNRCLRICLKRPAGRRHSPVYIIAVAKRYCGNGLFCGGIDDVERVSMNRFDPFSVNVKFKLFHNKSLYKLFCAV